MKRKILSVLLALVLCLGLLPVTSLAADVSYPVTGGSITFDLNTGAITGCEASVTKAVIPAEIMGVPVTSVKELAFINADNLTSVTLPEGLTTIGKRGFAYCKKLKQVSLPESLTSIGPDAFSECMALTSIRIPDAVTSLGQGAFSLCYKLQTVELGSGLKEIPREAFKACYALSSVTIPEGVVSIGTWAFSNDESLTSVILPDSLTFIDAQAFAWTGLTAVTIPDSVTRMESAVFDGCEDLSVAQLGNGLSVLPGRTFMGCSSLTNVVIPDGYTKIEDRAFQNCSSLEIISLPASLKEISFDAFLDSNNLTDVYFAGNQSQWAALKVDIGNQSLTAARLHLNSTGPIPVGNASPWAVPEIEKAAEMGLVPDILLGEDLTQSISRLEFAAVAVKVFENLSGAKALPDVTNPFTDTKDTEVLKAYNVGITDGLSATTFGPEGRLNREQCATMLTRVFKRCTMAGWTLSADSQFKLNYTMPAKFADDAQISAWAKDSVYFMAANKIIEGIGNNLFAPKNTTTAQEAQGYANATREQALAISVRMVENLK